MVCPLSVLLLAARNSDLLLLSAKPESTSSARSLRVSRPVHWPHVYPHNGHLTRVFPCVQHCMQQVPCWICIKSFPRLCRVASTAADVLQLMLRCSYMVPMLLLIYPTWFSAINSVLGGNGMVVSDTVYAFGHDDPVLIKSLSCWQPNTTVIHMTGNHYIPVGLDGNHKRAKTKSLVT